MKVCGDQRRAEGAITSCFCSRRKGHDGAHACVCSQVWQEDQ